jgi:hypothetical protein
MLIPIYRPEITVYERDADGLWASKNGTITNTLFYPLDDFDGPTEAGSRKVVKFGSEPFFTIIAPEGTQMVKINRAVYLQLPTGKKWDAWSALVLAKRRDDGLDLVRPGREAVSVVLNIEPVPCADCPDRTPGDPADVPACIEPSYRAMCEPVKPSGRVKQLSMF